MHIYEKDGKEYPSVTTILSCLGEVEITRWANYLGYKHINYDEELDRRAEFGTKVHDVLRSCVDDTYTSTIKYRHKLEMAEINLIKNRFVNMISKYQYKTIFTEKEFISETLGYAGTMDWLAKFNQKYLLLNDFKTSKATRFKHLLQLGGYRNLLEEAGYHLDGANIIIANKNYCRLFTIGKNQLSQYGALFDYLAQYYIGKDKIVMEENEEMKSLLNKKEG